MNIFLLGGGVFGTAIGNQLADNPQNKIVLLIRNKEQEEEINKLNTNKRYFPNKKLNKSLSATTEASDLLKAQIIFLAIPSKRIAKTIEDIKKFIPKDALIVNLSKGIFKNGETIVEYLKKELNTVNVVTMKGPTFSSELINNAHSIFTLGFKTKDQYLKIEQVIFNTNIHIDYTTDIRGVELLSVLKNIYAILIGIVDAKYNSPNTRFMILTKSFSEIRILLKELGGREDSLFLACGYGDVGITSLNDLSRNRTLGLLIGKGFYKSGSKRNKVVLEGLKTIKLTNSLLSSETKKRLPLFSKLESFFANKESNFDIHFDSLVDKKMKTVLTYGTFDLLHYGHIEILRRAKELGDRLVVGISTDEFNKIKGKECQIPYEKRKEFLEAVHYVDLVIPESEWEQKIEDIKNNEIDIFVMGDDWKGKFDNLKEYCEVIYLPRTVGISTTKLKSIIDK
ncbi:Glycerol-3-phosphate cytidylyltransferase [Mariniflexile rhizosphaerae]|uniref:glycerol-3-phosphate cytidylyltransferase n=1 Tax=unclassified Mariniflexile TaxID=2643887 RepID=UPI000CAB49DB|nr:Glycerol-3-phosphate cytidylyltransferase [Mariniflexile sp. TRM1-10]PLB20131.1 MAG: Glycerol-3-phosphate dehydrogenase [Flavobacteriaceae bacterium FS1-H7996/R]